MKKALFLFGISLLLLTFSCKKDSNESKQTKTIVSSASNDGLIINSSPRVVYSSYQGSQGEEIRIGWDSQGKAMRGFLSFDITGILPTDDNKVLIIDKAVLKVYESNTNLLPFDSDGDRTVEVELVNYGTLEAEDFTATSIASCGTIADWGYNVLEEHALDVSAELASYTVSSQTITQFQFMLHFTDDNNVSPATSPLESSMWNIFAGDETHYDDYRPILEITYHHENEDK